MPLRFAHVALNCRDPLVTERFYCDHFGFERARVIPLGEQQIVFLRCGDVYLELFDAEGDAAAPAAGDGPHAPGPRHLAFQVDSVDAKLAEMGAAAEVTFGPLDFDDFIPGWRTVWIRDPDGTVVEISQGYQDQAQPPPAPA
ncbi:MAG TPA: VOC family protein [Gemmatimonadota bacterium]|nr:VOC family protein [Gemmatimonadota bacterium]